LTQAREHNRRASKTRPGLVLAAAWCGVFVGFGSVLVFTFGIFLKPVTAAFGWSRGQVSLAFTIAALAVGICSPYIGRLLDCFPARRIILPCTAIYALAFASLGFLTPRFGHLIAVFLLLGIVGNGTTQLGYARVVGAWFDHNRGRAFAVVMSASATGSIVFPPFSQALISAFGWRFAYLALGGIILLFGIPLTALFLYEPSAKVVATGSTVESIAAPIWRDVLTFRFMGIAAGLLLFSLATNGLNAHWPALLTDRGLGAEIAATVLSAAGIASLLSRFLTGYLLDRFLAGRVVSVLFAVCSAGFLLIIYGTGTAMAFAGAVLVGVGLGAESDATPYLLTRYFGLRRFSELYGYTWSVYAFAGAVGPVVMGGVFDKTGSYRSALLIFLGMVIVAAALFGALPRYSCPPRSSNPAR
jgi:MFS family permease